MDNQLVTVEELKSALPPSQRKKITEDVVDTINNISIDGKYRDAYRDNLIGYLSLLHTGKYKLTHYIDAVRYVTFKLMGMTNVAAYKATFPDRFKRLVEENSSPETINAFAGAYNKNKLVNAVFEQTIVPSYILNADIHQKAINVQAELMMTAKSEKVRSDAANSLLTHLKPPETTKIELDIGIKNDSIIEDLRKTTMELAAQQKQLIERGISSTKDIAESRIIEAQYEEV